IETFHLDFSWRMGSLPGDCTLQSLLLGDFFLIFKLLTNAAGIGNEMLLPTIWLGHLPPRQILRKSNHFPSPTPGLPHALPPFRFGESFCFTDIIDSIRCSRVSRRESNGCGDILDIAASPTPPTFLIAK